jgi:hypothetical protein
MEVRQSGSREMRGAVRLRLRPLCAAPRKTLGLCLSDFGILELLLHKGPAPVNAIGSKIRPTSSVTGRFCSSTWNRSFTVAARGAALSVREGFRHRTESRGQRTSGSITTVVDRLRKLGITAKDLLK